MPWARPAPSLALAVRRRRCRRSTTCATRWPDYHSADGHLLYARALAESGRTEEALDEFKAVSNYFAGAEARVRWAILLEATGRKAEEGDLRRPPHQMRRAPKYVRKVQAEWIAVAEKQLRA